MERIISLLLTITLILALSGNANAAGLTQPGNATGSITGSLLNPGDTVLHKYDVTIEWANTGSVIYSKTTKTYTWNYNDLQYDVDVDTTARWIISEDAAVWITVNNRSDLPVKATCAAPVLIPGTGVTSLSGHYGADSDTDTATLEIPSAANGLEETGTVKTGTAAYSITGIEGEITEDIASIANLTITIFLPTTPEP